MKNFSHKLTVKEQEETLVKRAEKIWQRQSEIVRKTNPGRQKSDAWNDLAALMQAIVDKVRTTFGSRSTKV